MKKLLCGALALAFLAGPASAMGYFTPANTVAACNIISTLEATVLADENLANQVAGKQIVRTGTTSTIANVSPTLCAQIGGVVTSIASSSLAGAPTFAPVATSK